MAQAHQDINIGGGEGAGEPPRIDRLQVDSDDGHKVEDILLVDVIPANGQQTRFFERTFTFNCINMSTSFYFRVTFFRRDLSYVNCVTVLRRTDGGPGLVDVELSVTLDRSVPRLYVSHIFNSVESGRPYGDSTVSVIDVSCIIRLVRTNNPLEVNLAVTGCHGGQVYTSDSEGAVSTLSEHSSSSPSEHTSSTPSKDSSSRKRKETMVPSDAVEASTSKRSRMQSSWQAANQTAL